jgi:hypothetical protein
MCLVPVANSCRSARNMPIRPDAAGLQALISQILPEFVQLAFVLPYNTEFCQKDTDDSQHQQTNAAVQTESLRTTYVKKLVQP